MFKVLSLSAFLAFTPFFLVGQQPDLLEPVYDIPPTIAKLAEAEDFNGEWRRMDRQYRLMIEGAGSEDGLTAAYFNPNPVNVESAELEDTEDDPVIQVVLRDERYPGSTYTLRYLPQFQILVGSYARPNAPASDVYFVREDDLE